MPLSPHEPKRTYQHVAEKLREMIGSGEFGMSQRLPAERLLGKQLRVSRNVVREAILALEMAGYVETRHGVGTIVVSTVPKIPRRAIASGLDAGMSPSDIMAVRRIVESQVAWLAARTATEDEIEGLKQAVREIGKDDAFPEPSADWSRIFHLRLAEATHNPVWVLLVENLWHLMRSPLMESIRVRTKIYRNRRRRQQYRRRVVARIEQRDSAGARRAMEKHIDTVTAFLFDKPVS